MHHHLELKIVAHCGELQFIEVRGNRKPFGQHVIEAHRMLKNSVDSDNYVMISTYLVDGLGMAHNYQSRLYEFQDGQDEYDGKRMAYVYSLIDPIKLNLPPVQGTIHLTFDRPPDFSFTKELPVRNAV
jgi:hypothetical protein